MRILGIETSCDDTAMAVIEVERQESRDKSSRHLALDTKQIRVLSNVISSQVKLHAKYGGVVPSLAAREHTKNIGHVFKLALKKAAKNGNWKVESGKFPIDAIAVTRGPGLGPSLLVGITFAKTISWLYQKPLIGVNHLEGHIYSNWLPIAVSTKSQAPNHKQIPNPKKQKTKTIFLALNLIVSGGHTELVLMKGYGKYELIGETLDDAVGEAFDKAARLLGLSYPGGPAIAARAAKFKVKSEKFKIALPRPMEHSKDFNFSYSGLKTAVLYLLRDLQATSYKLQANDINEIAHEFQEAALDVLVKKTVEAAKKYKVNTILLSGGVSANKILRERLQKESVELGVNYLCPPMEYTTDNGAMIAVAGYFNYMKRKKTKTALSAVVMNANLNF
ncbi:MAG: tRNA (adenosine(37)-N6)-threonylcarbamoyltransferase complex transferase subunit TsaD [Candidatus Paceibacterota bacterium]